MRQNNVISLISRIREYANTFIVRQLQEEGIVGLVPSHGDILTILFASEAMTMSELAQRIHRSKPTVTVLVDKLLQEGYVAKRKSVSDQRITHITLTDKGRSLEPVFADISSKLNSLVYDGLTEEESITFERLLRTVSDSFLLIHDK